MKIKVMPVEAAQHPPAGKLADVELQFEDGLLQGLKLVGLAVWAGREDGALSVSMPSRQYSINGERRSFALLRPMLDSTDLLPLKKAVIAAYTEVMP